MPTKIKKIKAKEVKDLVDVNFHNHGSIITIVCNTEAAREWVEEKVALESWSGTPEQFMAETRMAYDIYQGMRADGLVCE